MKQVAVIIPLYKNQHTPAERLSLLQTHTVLKNHPLIVVHPEGLDVSPIRDEYPRFEYRAFDKKYFDGLEGYNRFMLSSEFYKAFADYEYILISQPDVYIFRDELEEWCGRGYDYIGAPWLERDVYKRPFIKQYMKWEQARKHSQGKRCRQDLFGKVGNGGMSLRRVSAHIEAIGRYRSVIDYYLETPRPFYAEDIFWGTEVKEFRYPSEDEALLFAFDKDPDYCYYRTGGRLPFGCHAWNKCKTRRFWFGILGLEPFTNKSSRYPI